MKQANWGHIELWRIQSSSRCRNFHA